jgi:zinc D-Ala-D-Ala carboxypeptidase
VALLTVVLIAGPARAQSPDDLSGDKAKLEQVRSQRAAAASKVDALRADDNQLKQAIDALDDDVKGQEALYKGAKRKADDAQTEADAARQAEQAQAAQVQQLEAGARKAALDAYVNPVDELTEVLASGSPTDAIVRRALTGLSSRRSMTVIDELDSARQDLAYQRTLAVRAAKKAEDKKNAANDRLQKLQTSLTRQKETVSGIEDQLDAALSEAAGLAGLDAQLSADLAAKQADLAARLAAARALSDRAGGGADLTVGSGSDVGGITVVEVGGIKVNASIASQLARLLSAANSAGIHLGGGGYRSSSGQIAVRRANCGSSRYAIYSMPPSRCRPPAARPGKSMHELGLAIDFTCDGALIQSHANRCFQWLQAHAASYGLQNYWREPWHWSTNGR